MAAKKCLYEILSVAQDANDAELKKAYRAAALEHHPDKNRDRANDAAEHFKLVQEAYDVLSDPHERAWYDAHRAQILRGGDGAGDATDATGVDLFAHFSSAAYDGFSQGPRSFYAVYAALFSELSKEEVLAAGRDARMAAAPGFGEADAEWDEVRAFYGHWEGFNSVKTFAFADKWNLAEGNNRELRRAMEKENKRNRTKAKKEFNAAVRELVTFVKKRDPRVKARKAKEEEMRAEKEQQRRLRDAKAAEEKRKRAKEAKIAREDAMEEDAVALDEILRSIELDDKIERRKNRKRAERAANADGDEADESEELAGDDESNDEEENQEEEEDLYCVACKKKFKTPAQVRNHKSSKKHIAAAAALRKQIEKEDALFFDCRNSEDAPLVDIVGNGVHTLPQDDVVGGEDISVTIPSSSKKKKKKKAKNLPQQLFGEASLEEDKEMGETGKAPVPPSAQECPPGHEARASTMEQDVDEAEPKKATVSKKQKRRERERRRAEEQAGRDSAASNSLVCNVCNASFASRTKLMKHVKNVGHANFAAAADSNQGGR